jgi:uncharacterized protein YunC (DUF1805 family)
MMKSVDIELNGKIATGVEVPLPKAPLVLAYGKNGFVMCGYLNIQAAEKLGVAAAIVRGVSTVQDLLEAEVREISKSAAAKGVKTGMTGKQALAQLA